MRVIAGAVKGRKLKSIEGSGTRPTTDRVKESVFNIIQFDIEGRNVLDLFAGTGQMGIEALSRGAVSAVFVDQKKEAVRAVTDNIALTGYGDSAEVIQQDALVFLSGCEKKFELIFLDPPYDSGLLKKSLKAIATFDILSISGIIVCETSAESVLPEINEPLVHLRDYIYGKTRISIISRK